MKKLAVLLTLYLCIFCLLTVYSESVQDNLSENLVRLHIIANSDSDTDQNIKLSIRDEILNLSRSTKSVPTISDCEKTAKSYLKKTDAPYSASVSYEHCFVPKKEYKSLSLPQGFYDCIKITLGDGIGKNWWCIAYPPLCYTESMFGNLSDSGIGDLSQILDEESLSAIITSGDINFRLKIVDEFQKLLRLIKPKLTKMGT